MRRGLRDAFLNRMVIFELGLKEIRGYLFRWANAA
jgi:hypothetical protein